MIGLMSKSRIKTPPFAPPFLRAGQLWIGQTANILAFLGPREGLAPRGEAGQLWVNQLQLTIADFVAEIHDTHHPVGAASYYEDQKKEAKRRAEDFRRSRAPKFLGYFEKVLKVETFARSRVFRCFGDSLRALPATDIAGDVIGGRERLSRR